VSRLVGALVRLWVSVLFVELAVELVREQLQLRRRLRAFGRFYVIGIRGYRP
jgi:hypothetical protein